MNNERRKQLAALLDDLQQTGLRDAMAKLEDVKNELESLRDEEQEAFDNLPPSLQDGDRGQAMNDAIEKMDGALSTLDDLITGFDFDLIEEAFANIDEARA